MNATNTTTRMQPTQPRFFAPSMAWLAPLAFAMTLGGLTVGCSAPEETDNTAQQPSARDTAEAPLPSGLPSKVWPRDRYYHAALTLMSDDERMAYHDQINDYRRDLYLREIGADARVDMQFLLRVGDSLDDVRGAKQVNERTGGITYNGGKFSQEIWEHEPLRFGSAEVWAFKRFNGRGYTRMSVDVVDGKIAGWHSYSEQDWIRNEQILAQCSNIERELAKILRPGMPMSSIAGTVEQFPQKTAEAFGILADNAQGVEVYVTWKMRVHRAEFEQRIKPLSLLGDRVDPDADPLTEPRKAYAYRFRNPLETKIEGRRAVWRYEVPFGKRAISYFLVFIDQELKEWYAEPSPERNAQGY